MWPGILNVLRSIDKFLQVPKSRTVMPYVYVKKNVHYKMLTGCYGISRAIGFA